MTETAPKVKIIKRSEIEKERDRLEGVEIAHMYILMERYQVKAFDRVGHMRREIRDARKERFQINP